MDKKAVNEAADDLKGNDKKNRPWEKSIKQKHKAVKKEYQQIGALLMTADDEKTRAIGESIKEHGERLPVPQTRHELLKQAITDQLNARRREQQRDQGRER
jgi:hypothetical protein